MSAKTCKKFNRCSAPLCPMEPVNDSAVWYTDEEICSNADAPEWVKRQRKIKRKVKDDLEDNGAFTVAMLKRNCIIKKGFKGIDCDKNSPENLVVAWLGKHPEIIVTEEMRERARRVTAERLLNCPQAS